MSQDTQPDWDSIAEKFDTWVPHLAPVGDALLDRLEAEAGESVLDVASGTGEPALTLARRLGGVTVFGTDAANGMVAAAQRKAEREALSNITFYCMSAERLEFDDNRFDRVMSRFGAMLFEDPVQGLKEMYRVLKPGGRFAIAVWSTPESMTTLHWASQVFQGRVPEESQPPTKVVTRLGLPGALEQALKEAGYGAFEVEAHRFDYEFPSFEVYWQAVEDSEIMRQQFDALQPGEQERVRDEIALLASAYQTERGLVIPHEYLLAFGDKQ